MRSYKINLNGLKFSDYFELCRGTKTRSKHQYKIQTKLAKLNCYKYSFFVKIIKFWNDLPSNGNRIEWSPIRSVTIGVINRIGRPRSGSPICFFKSMITDRIAWHEVLLPVNHNFNKICDI